MKGIKSSVSLKFLQFLVLYFDTVACAELLVHHYLIL